MGENEVKKPSHRRNRERNKRIRLYTNIAKYALIVIVAAVVIAAVVSVVNKTGGFGSISKKPNANNGAGDNGNTEVTNVLEKDSVPEINDLVNRYFAAIHDCDIEALSKIVASTAAVSEDQLRTEAEFVESYNNVVCYVAKGVVDKTYITYVSYGLKLLNIATPAPCMMRLYICTNDNGDLYIFNENTVDENTAAYMDELNSSAEVAALIKTVDDSLQTARGVDAELDKFVAMLNGENSDGPQEPASEAPEESSAPVDNSPFEDVNETVYAKENVRIRAAATADAEVVGALAAGESIKRTGYNDNWSRVEYNGDTCYIAAGFLTTKNPNQDDDGFISVDEKVYAKESVRVRKSPKSDAEEIGYLLKGDSCKRIAYNDNWSRVLFDGGRTGYIAAGYLTEHAPDED